ncbi:MAG: hypothetical protein JSU92_08275 [Deltaproteobacteria bacterium]|nr:MAG: hypothetical protein JSU92_08275 [Deltaproteobacteria bacterium]
MLKKSVVFTVALIFLHKPVLGGIGPQGVGVKPLGMGGAFRAIADDNSALSFNPGGITQSLKYSIEALYYWSELSEGFPQKVYHISIIDSKTAGIGGGFSFTREKLTQGGREDTYTIALAENYRSYLHIGISGKIFSLRGIDDNDSSFATDLGIIARPWKQYLSAGIVGYNIVKTGSENISPRLGFGLATNPSKIITLAADTVKDMDGDNIQYSFGGEVLLRGQFGLRGGYSGDRNSNSFYCVGLGWYAPRITLNYGFQQGVGDLDLEAHSVSLIIYF